MRYLILKKRGVRGAEGGGGYLILVHEICQVTWHDEGPLEHMGHHDQRLHLHRYATSIKYITSATYLTSIENMTRVSTFTECHTALHT